MNLLKQCIWFAIGISATFAAGAATKDLGSILSENGVVLNWPKSSIAEIVQRRKAGNMSFLDLRSAAAGGKQLELEIIAPIEKNAATTMFNLKRRGVESAYANRPTPYEGEVTNTTVCPRQFQPKKLDPANSGQIGDILIARTNARRAWGNCTEDPSALKGANAFFYDPEHRRLVQMTLYMKSQIYSDDEVNQFFRSIRFK